MSRSDVDAQIFWDTHKILVPRECAACEMHVTEGYTAGSPLEAETAMFVCQQCADMHLRRFGARSWWESTEYGLQCRGCEHVLPFLKDKRAFLCAACVRERARKLILRQVTRPSVVAKYVADQKW